MTTTEEEVTDILWEEMKTFAMEQQQSLYELLPDCTEYKSDEHKYLKQNIGYAIYGPPKNTKNASSTKEDNSKTKNSDDTDVVDTAENKDANTEDNCFCKTENLDDTDVVDTVGYSEGAQKIIDKIYNKICTCIVETNDSQPIYLGVIYNLIFRPKTNVKSKKEVKKEKVKEKTKEDEKIKEETKQDEKSLLIVMPVPIFTIRKSIQKEFKKSAKQENTSTASEMPCETYETWYIDATARVYKNWVDYKENNNLPQCTMVLPKHGFYEPNPAYHPKEDYSTVWLEIMDSPACKWKAKFCKTMDIASSFVGFGTVGLSVASLFTPLAPVVVVPGLAALGITSIWSIGRNSQQLADRSSHEESINISDKEAFAHYLSIVSTTLGLGAMGGAAIISNVAARGMTINTFARVAFNTVQGSSLILSGIGIIYQCHCMYDKYKEDKTIDIIDALNLATHLMFFCGSIVNIRFASDIIESTQGKVINDYKETLSTKRLRKKFNRIRTKAAENNTCKMSENAEVIRYIKHRQELLSSQSVINNTNSTASNSKNNTGGNNTNSTVRNCKNNTGGNSTNSISHNIVWSIDRGRLKVNGITLLDPFEFVTRLIKLGIFIGIDQNNSFDPQNDANESIVEQLTKKLCELLSKFYVSDDCPKSTKLPTVPDFEPLIKEISSMHFNEDYLKMLFEIAEKLLKRSRNMDDFFLLAFTFVWQYCKANIKQWGRSLCPQNVSGKNVLQRIIIAVFEAIDMISNNLYDAFVMYMDSILHGNGEYKF